MTIFSASYFQVTRAFQLELAFTATYQQHLQDDPALREAYCLQAMMPYLFDAIQPGDLFAGRTHYLPVGFGLELAAGGSIYYCHEDQIRPQMDGLTIEERESVEAMLAFWKKEATIDGHLVHSLAPEVLQATSNHVAEMGGRLAGSLLDFGKLTRLGIPGLRREINAGR